MILHSIAKNMLLGKTTKKQVIILGGSKIIKTGGIMEEWMDKWTTAMDKLMI